MKKTMAPEDAVTTYRYVRLGLVALVLFLAASVLQTAWDARGFQTSISAYFYTGTHSVFIVALCGIGALLIIYKGSTLTEDALLNFAGILAFVVGLVPAQYETPLGTGLPSDYCPKLFIDNNIRALLIACVAIAAIYGVIAVIPRPKDTDKPTSKVLEKLLACLLLAAIIAGVVVYATDPALFAKKAHGIAASTMFCAIIIVVLHYACYAAVSTERVGWAHRTFVILYTAIAATMIVSVGLVIGLHVFSHSHGVIIVEATFLAEFAIFWLVQTVDLWERDKYQKTTLSELLPALR